MVTNKPIGHPCQQVRIPHGHAGQHNGWFSFVRGAMITRRVALRVLLFGPTRGKLEHTQANDPHHWGM